jgi:hypothetical protein
MENLANTHIILRWLSGPHNGMVRARIPKGMRALPEPASTDAPLMSYNPSLLRARSSIETICSEELTCFRTSLYVYIGSDADSPEGIIYYAMPTQGCYPSLMAADAAICSHFFSSGAAHRAVLLAGPDSCFEGILIPTNIGNLSNHLYITQDNVIEDLPESVQPA